MLCYVWVPVSLADTDTQQFAIKVTFVLYSLVLLIDWNTSLHHLSWFSRSRLTICYWNIEKKTQAIVIEVFQVNAHSIVPDDLLETLMWQTTSYLWLCPSSYIHWLAAMVQLHAAGCSWASPEKISTEMYLDFILSTTQKYLQIQ